MTKWKMRLSGVAVLVSGVILAHPFRRATPGFPSQAAHPDRPDLQLQRLAEVTNDSSPAVASTPVEPSSRLKSETISAGTSSM